MPPKQSQAMTGCVLRSNSATSHRQLRSAGPVAEDTAGTVPNVVSSGTKTRPAHKGGQTRSANSNPVDIKKGHDEVIEEREDAVDNAEPVGEDEVDELISDFDGDESKTTMSASRDDVDGQSEADAKRIEGE